SVACRLAALQSSVRPRKIVLPDRLLSSEVPFFLPVQLAVASAEMSSLVRFPRARPSLPEVEFRVLSCRPGPGPSPQATWQLPARPRTFLRLPVAAWFEGLRFPLAHFAIRLVALQPSVRLQKFSSLRRAAGCPLPL